ncbi:hypothetical protein Nmel_001916 [Mimus melanotis]
MRWPITCGAASTEGAGGTPGTPRGLLDPQGPAGAARDQQDPIPSPPVTPPIPAAGSNKVPLWGVAVGQGFQGSGCCGGELQGVARATGCGSALRPGRRRPPRIPGSKGAAVPQVSKVHDGAGVTPQHPPHDAPPTPPDSQEAKLGGRGFIGGLHSWWRLH